MTKEKLIPEERTKLVEEYSLLSQEITALQYNMQKMPGVEFERKFKRLVARRNRLGEQLGYQEPRKSSSKRGRSYDDADIGHDRADTA